MEVLHVRHLDHEQDVGTVARSGGLGQALEMPGAPLGGGVGEGTDAIELQGHSLHLQKAGAALQSEGEVEAGITVGGFRPEIGDRAQPAGEEPLLRRGVGGLGIHIDQAAALADGDQVIFCFPVGVVGALAPDLCPGRQQLPAAAGIFHMDGFLLSVDGNLGDEAVGPGEKSPGNHVAVAQGSGSFLTQ